MYQIIVVEACVVYTDLSQEVDLFCGEGDEQFDVYREMKKYNSQVVFCFV